MILLFKKEVQLAAHKLPPKLSKYSPQVRANFFSNPPVKQKISKQARYYYLSIYPVVLWDSLPDRHIKYFLTTQALFAEHKYFLFYAQQKMLRLYSHSIKYLIFSYFRSDASLGTTRHHGSKAHLSTTSLNDRSRYLDHL